MESGIAKMKCVTADELEPTRYIGQRLRSWRHERNWSGQEAASHLGTRLDRQVEWPELRRYEEGAVLPDTPTATHLAAVYGRQLANLLTLKPTPATVASAPWPPQTPSAEDLAAVRQLLERRGHDPRHSERLFQLGLSRGSAEKWLRNFSPEDAFGWIAVRFGPIEAVKWASRGHTVGEAIRLKSLGLTPERILATGDHSLSGFGAPIEVIVARDQLGVDRNDSTRVWAEHGWDLLASISWELSGFDPSSARPWNDQGFDPLWAKALKASFSPAEAGLWRDTTVGAPAWEGWRAHGFQPSDAEGFAEAGIDFVEAVEWRDLGFGPAEAVAFRSEELGARAADHWRSIGVAAGDVRLWIDLDLAPSDLRVWRAVSPDPTVITILVKSGLSPKRARRWLAAGVDPRAIEDWEAADFAPDEASEWAGTSPERARRLLARGISPEFDRTRRAAGAARVVAARAALAERRDLMARGRRPAVTSSQPSQPNLGTFHARLCSACDRPVSVNGRCGCS